MRRVRRLRRQTRWRQYAATAVFICAVLAGGRLAIGVMGGLLERAAYASAVLTLPQGGLELLRRRFAPEVKTPPTTPEPESSQSESEPPYSSEAPSPQEPSSGSNIPQGPAPDIPDQHKGRLIEELMVGEDSSTFMPLGTGYLRNYTNLSFDKIEEALKITPRLKLAKTKEPLVLVIHTHATESYAEYDAPFYDKRNSWRSTDNNKNVTRVGYAIAAELEKRGIGVIHDTTQHDYPSYNGSYDNSAKTIKEILKRYPTIKIVLDVHRDAIERVGQVVVKPTTVVDGKKAAQIMVVAGADDGTMNMPGWKTNFTFAVDLTNRIEADYPTLTRPLFFCHRKYNMDLSPGSLLLEFGSNGNTLEEAVYTGQLVGRSLAKLIEEMKQ